MAVVVFLRCGEFKVGGSAPCPKCGYKSVERMPTDACQFFYDCKGCGERLKPVAGDCCVFCSYGTMSCPPMQTNGECYRT